MNPHGDAWSMLFALAVVGAVAYYAWLKADFVIRVRDGVCRHRGNLPLVVQKAVTQFLLDDIRPRGPITIRGRRVERRLRLHFSGDLTPGEKQRIRNYLLTHR